MATPKKVARSLRKTAIRLSAVRREVVVEAAEKAVNLASDRGGTFFGGRYPLFAEVVEKKDSAKRTTVLVYPKPAGAWVIKSFGRGESVGLPLLSTRQGPRPRAKGTVGDGRWPKIQEEVFEEYGEIMEQRIEEVIDDG